MQKLNTNEATAKGSAVPDKIAETIKLWAERVERRATLLLGTSEDIVGRMALEEVAEVNAWLDSLKGGD